MDSRSHLVAGNFVTCSEIVGCELFKVNIKLICTLYFGKVDYVITRKSFADLKYSF